jgi:hypothetical protein
MFSRKTLQCDFVPPSPLLDIQTGLYLYTERRKTKSERGEGGFCHCVICFGNNSRQRGQTPMQASYNNLSMIPPLKEEFNCENDFQLWHLMRKGIGKFSIVGCCNFSQWGIDKLFRINFRNLSFVISTK